VLASQAVIAQPEIDYMKQNMMDRSYDAFAYFKSLAAQGSAIIRADQEHGRKHSEDH